MYVIGFACESKAKGCEAFKCEEERYVGGDFNKAGLDDANLCGTQMIVSNDCGVFD